MPNQFQNMDEFFKFSDRTKDFFKGDKSLQEYLRRRYQTLLEKYTESQPESRNDFTQKQRDEFAHLDGQLRELEVIAGHLDLNIYQDDKTTLS